MVQVLKMALILVWFPVLVTGTEDTDTIECFCLKSLKDGLNNPVHMEATTLDGKDIFLIAEQRGIIHRLNPRDGTLQTYIDLRSEIVSSPDLFDERGLLGFALHPNFKTNKKLYTYTIRGVGGKDYVAISVVTGQDLAEEQLMMLIEQPGTRRNGGQLLFGVDGYLYIFVGDGGPAHDNRSDAQTTSTLLGKVLRVDVEHETVVNNKLQYYAIPEDNPKKSGWLPEIYALGIRNMWRCCLDKGDPQTASGKGRIFCGDLGSDIADELNMITKGSNYGWHYREGSTCLNNTICGNNQTLENEMFPIKVFERGESAITALIGGPLYRGSLFKTLQGHLLYGDYMNGFVSSLKEVMPLYDWMESGLKPCASHQCGCNTRALPPQHLLSFGEDEQGEVYLLMTDEPSVTSPKGSLLKMLPSDSTKDFACGFTPASLSQHLLWICVLVFCLLNS